MSTVSINSKETAIDKELNRISQITDNIFLSGAYPMQTDPKIISNLGITHILSCVSSEYAGLVHKDLFEHVPNLTVMYLPYSDDVEQNLWELNKNKIEISKLLKSVDCAQNTLDLYKLYENRPLIEIGSHFIASATKSNGKVLVHCMAGISRSVSVLSYYIMKATNVNFDKVLYFIKSKRFIANPNVCFVNQLNAYDFKRSNFNETIASKIVKMTRSNPVRFSFN
jgi:protein-tyrosine phosphatase